MSRYTTELIWPPFKGKAHKVVDSATGAGVGLCRTPEGARRKARAMNIAACTGIVHEPGKPARAEYVAPEPRLPYACPTCDQMSDTAGVCQPCRKLERAPQGVTVRLFEPAPTQLEGQMSF